MKCLSILLLCCAFTIYCTLAQQHSLFSGNCVKDNNTIPIYTQMIVLKNPQAGTVYKQPTPVRRWYDMFSRFSFRRRATAHHPHQSGPVLNITIVFPPNGTANHFRIKCIEVIDNLSNNTGGYATIIEGGVNHNFTKILLKSQPGGNLNNKVNILTYKENGPQSVHPKPAYGWAPPYQPQPQWPANTNHVPGRSYWSK